MSSNKTKRDEMIPRVIVSGIQGTFLGGCFILTEGVYYNYKAGSKIWQLLRWGGIRRAITPMNLFVPPCIFIAMAIAIG